MQIITSSEQATHTDPQLPGNKQQLDPEQSKDQAAATNFMEETSPPNKYLELYHWYLRPML